MAMLLKNAVLLDANYDNVPLDILVEGDKILQVGTGLTAEQEIDLTGYTILPGFIDAHIHVATKEGEFSDEALLAWAENGVTTVRELGMLSTMPMEEYAPWIQTQNKRPQAARLIATGKYIDVAGGYGCGPEPNKVVGNVVEDVAGAEKMVEKAHDLGFPGIKIGIADGMAGAPRMSNEMIAAIGKKCKELGMFTACHIGTSASLMDMVNGGIGEAGHTPNDPMPQELIEKMVTLGVPMDTTIGDPDKAMEPPPGMVFPGGPGGVPPMGTQMDPSEADPFGRGRARERTEFSASVGNGEERTLRGRGGPGGMPGGPGGMDPAKMAEQKKQQNKIMRENLKRFYDAGGKIILGTDLIHSKDFRKDATIPVVEMRQLVESGVPFKETIKAGTISAAEVVGTAQEEGTIEAGKLANLIAVKGRVDESFQQLKQVAFVMHYGTIIKNLG